MKKHLILAATAAVLAACDARVTPVPPGETVEKNTTIINPPAGERKTTTTTETKK